VRLRLSLQHLTVLFRGVHSIAKSLEGLRVRDPRLARPESCPVSRGAPFVREKDMSLDTWGRGVTYAARPAVAVVGCNGVSDAITVSGRSVVQGKER
jgi:hypothetical protein